MIQLQFLSGDRFKRLLLTLGFLAALARAGATDVQGVLPTSTWTEAQSPYRVRGALTVPTEAALAIEPGVTVAVDPGISIVVQGKLEALGTAEKSIRFQRQNPARAWGGLLQDNCSTLARMTSY
jgi:hypothetical protein